MMDQSYYLVVLASESIIQLVTIGCTRYSRNGATHSVQSCGFMTVIGKLIALIASVVGVFASLSGTA